MQASLADLLKRDVGWNWSVDCDMDIYNMKNAVLTDHL